MTDDSLEMTARITEQAHYWRQRLGPHFQMETAPEEFIQWIHEDERHQAAFDRSITLDHALYHLKVSDINSQYMKPSMVEQRIKLMDAARALLERVRIEKQVAVPAMVIVIALVFFIWRWPTAPLSPSDTFIPVTYATNHAERRTILLSDGTSVQLDAGSILDFVISDTERKAELREGTALFLVSKDASRPFIVRANMLTATVLGTVFQVRNNGDMRRVSVSEGSVRVSFPQVIEQKPSSLISNVVLSEGEQVSASPNTGIGKAKAIDPSHIGDWQSNKISYEQGTLSEIVADANRYSSHEIYIADPALYAITHTVTGTFKTDDIEGLLAMLELSFPVAFVRDNGLIAVTKK